MVLPDEIYVVCKQYYEEHRDELKLRHGIRSLTAFVSYLIREQLKTQGIIETGKEGCL